MNAIFSIDSPAMRALSRFADLVVLNLLFVVTSLPLITLGASLTALNHTAMKIVTDDYESIPRTYLASFRSNFRQATLLGFAAIGLLAVLYAWYVVIDDLTLPGLAKLALFAVLALVAYRLIGTLAFVFPYQATFADSPLRVLDNARRMSAKHPLSALLLVLVTVLPIVVGIFYPQFFVWGLLWVVIGFAAIAFVNATVCISVFRRYGLDA